MNEFSRWFFNEEDDIICVRKAQGESYVSYPRMLKLNDGYLLVFSAYTDENDDSSIMLRRAKI